MAKRPSLFEVALVFSLLGLVFEVGVNCEFGSQDPQSMASMARPTLFGSSSRRTQRGSSAPPGYKSFPGVGAYKFHAYGVPRAEAKRVCEQEGAKMLVVNSLAEASVIKWMFLFNLISPGAADGAHVWVGLQERGTHGKFFTNDGQPLEQTGFSVWSILPPQPNDPGAYDCVTFHGLFGVLYDDACDIKYPFVCEF